MNYKPRYRGYEIPIGGRMGHYTYELSESAWAELMSVLTEEQKEKLGLNKPAPTSYGYAGPR